MTVTRHIVFATDDRESVLWLHCEQCGTDLPIAILMPADERTAEIAGFVARHEGCEEMEA